MTRLFKFIIFIILIGAIGVFCFYRFTGMKVNNSGTSNTEQVVQENSTDDAGCPPEGLTHEYRIQELNKLKNRSAFPAENNFDSTISLQKLLTPGDDRERWSTDKAVTITGYVTDVKIGGTETCNCKSKDPAHRDTHIELVLNPMNFTNTEKLIVEVTPRIRNIMAVKGEDWSTRTLRDKLLGRWLKVSGWLLFDEEHSHQAENTNPGNERSWRATAWEVHPITSMEVVDRPR